MLSLAWFSELDKYLAEKVALLESFLILTENYYYAQVKRFRMETKAAKTLGIIVGGFVFCWLPFFSVYVVRAFCGDCVSPIVFSVLFWLGYCNSAINPLIYALFSKDFR